MIDGSIGQGVTGSSGRKLPGTDSHESMRRWDEGSVADAERESRATVRNVHRRHGAGVHSGKQ